ncbi:hypothetical protein JSQ81_06280 [Sporosarcina sp. Marseille-Q4063]|uniref:MutS-related protein n=1 Tax=Sporosarcina sp. Marseille-Q4063 TaxID=2810514 RepID=UPI001BAEE7BB|nr:hypothetical protein [Sporosarcina sp. Marseille-Q4063]QUW23167.1 hypothetical protein JSQ81_06280 [Sporosarcina sp. Marseille-Q4063]
MGDPMVIIIIGVIIFIAYHLLTKNKKKLEKLRREWEKGEFHALSEDLKSISSYWSNKKNSNKSYSGVDQLTWDDLAMDEIFNKLNYTQSTVGSEYLFNQLRDIDPKLEGVNDKEELYNLLATNQELREQVLLILSGLGKLNYTNSSSFFHENNHNKIDHSYLYVLLALLPVASVAVMFFSLQYGIVSLIIAFTINMLVYYRNKNRLENKMFSITYAAAVINTGKRLTSVNHPELNAYVNDIKKNVKPIKKISFWGTMISTGGGGEFDFISEYIRMLFMLDFIAYNKIVQTITDYQEEYRRVWERIGELDAAIAVAFYRKSLDTYCRPAFIEDEKLSFENIAHPLIPKPVTNTSALGKSTLVTGSNASGKSTYIKAVAINAILAQTINTVLATKWTMKPSYIVTSMAIQDNVLDGDSYFIAEIKSLKRIIRLIEEGKPVISFIDEILKGTNTIERIAASASMMEWLAANKGMNLIASHDIELTEMTRKIYENYHFRESIENGEVLFDYKIHDGPSQTRNAIKLLEILAYPECITKNANRLAKHFTEWRNWEEIKGNEVQTWNL